MDVDPESATVVLEDGSKYTGDIVLGADGVSVGEDRSNKSRHSPVLIFLVQHTQNRSRTRNQASWLRKKLVPIYDSSGSDSEKPPNRSFRPV